MVVSLKQAAVDVQGVVVGRNWMVCRTTCKNSSHKRGSDGQVEGVSTLSIFSRPARGSPRVDAIHPDCLSTFLANWGLGNSKPKSAPCQGNGAAIAGARGGGHGGVSFHRTESYVKENSPPATTRKLAHPPPGDCTAPARRLAEHSLGWRQRAGRRWGEPGLDLHLKRPLDGETLQPLIFLSKYAPCARPADLSKLASSQFFLLKRKDMHEEWMLSSVVHNSKEIIPTFSTLVLGRTPGMWDGFEHV